MNGIKQIVPLNVLEMHAKLYELGARFERLKFDEVRWLVGGGADQAWQRIANLGRSDKPEHHATVLE